MNDDKTVLYHSKLRLWRQKITLFRNKIRNSAYPGHVDSVWILIALVNGLHFAKKNSRYGLMNYLTEFSVIAK